MRLVRKGDQGPVVREIQGNLRRAGADVRVDGIFGSRTEQALKAFQARHHLPVDGVAGPHTIAAMHGEHAGAPASGHDPFDVWEFTRWLGRLGGDIYDAVTPDNDPAKAVAPAAGKPSSSMHSSPPAQRRPVAGRPVVSPGQNKKHRRIGFSGYAGRGYVVQDYEKYVGYAIKLVGGISVAPHNPAKLIKNECAQFVQFFGVPHTSQWRRGPQVCFLEPGSIPPGTVIATLRDNRYYSDYSGRSHVGIYISHDPHGKKGGGLILMDQYNHNPIRRRPKLYSVDANAMGNVSKKPWVDSAGKRQTRRVSWTRDGEEYFVLMTGS